MVNEYDKRTAAGNACTTIPEDYDIQLFFRLFHYSDGIHISLFALFKGSNTVEHILGIVSRLEEVSYIFHRNCMDG